MATLAINGGTPVRDDPVSIVAADRRRRVRRRRSRTSSAAATGVASPSPACTAAPSRRRSPPTRALAHGILMMNGTVTMEVACKALGIGWGDEVIVPALTFAATAYAPMAAGALPVFVDVTPDTWTIDPELVEAAITDRTRAIMPVHLGHQMADMDRIMEIARRHGLAVIEDCAHAHGQRWKDHGAGCIGDFGSFSHQSSKILTSGEGGTLLTNDDDARAARPLDHRLRPREGPRREGLHVRRELPAVGAERGAPRGRDATVPRPAGSSARSPARRSRRWPPRSPASRSCRPMRASRAGASTTTS